MRPWPIISTFRIYATIPISAYRVTAASVWWRSKDAPTRSDPEILTIWQETMQTPCVAIGGITVQTAASLAEAGADFLAVSSGVWDHPGGPAEAVRAFEVEIARGAAARSRSIARGSHASISSVATR